MKILKELSEDGGKLALKQLTGMVGYYYNNCIQYCLSFLSCINFILGADDHTRSKIIIK